MSHCHGEEVLEKLGIFQDKVPSQWYGANSDMESDMFFL